MDQVALHAFRDAELTRLRHQKPVDASLAALARLGHARVMISSVMISSAARSPVRGRDRRMSASTLAAAAA